MSPSARAAAPIGRYAISSDVVKDLETSLVWQRNTSLSTHTWSAAATYCQGLSAGGFSTGWRLPTAKELQSIVDATVLAPALDQVAFPNTSANAFFWASTLYAPNTTRYWGVSFFYGIATSNTASTAASVRCVH